jgi:hypothetical protein
MSARRSTRVEGYVLGSSETHRRAIYEITHKIESHAPPPRRVSGQIHADACGLLHRDGGGGDPAVQSPIAIAPSIAADIAEGERIARERARVMRPQPPSRIVELPAQWFLEVPASILPSVDAFADDDDTDDDGDDDDDAQLAAALAASAAEAERAPRPPAVFEIRADVQADDVAPSPSPSSSCVICLDAAPTMTILHRGNDIGHRVLCAPCAAQLRARGFDTCPLCKEPIDRVIKLITM